jgi:F0F1-type ATP synthase assembly protein I
MPEVGTQHTSRASARRNHEKDLIPREFLRAIAVWSLIPAYLLAGAFLGWLVDRWLGTWPFGAGIGLLVALGFAVRDMLRLRDTL